MCIRDRFGNEGKDRSLFFGDDNLVDRETEDARLEFRNGGDAWTNREIEVIDNGLFLLTERTQNTRLLKGTQTTEPLVFVKEFTIASAERVGNNELVQVDTQVFDPVLDRFVTQSTFVRTLSFGDWDETNQDINDFITAEVPREIAYTWSGPDAVSNVFPCLLYTSPSPRDATLSRMPSSA